MFKLFTSTTKSHSCCNIIHVCLTWTLYKEVNSSNVSFRSFEKVNKIGFIIFFLKIRTSSSTYTKPWSELLSCWKQRWCAVRQRTFCWKLRRHLWQSMTILQPN